MRRPDLIILVFFAIVHLSAFAQNQNPHFKMLGQDPKFIAVDESFSKTTEIKPFKNNVNKIYGLAVSAEIHLLNENSKVEFVFVDANFNEYLIYETNGYLQDKDTVTIDNLCEETRILDGTKVYAVNIIIQDAEVNLKRLHYVTRAELAGNVNEIRKEIKKEQNADKITQINKSIKAKGQHWVAGPTGVSELTYAEKKKLYGQSSFPSGFEYYAGGIITAGTDEPSTILKSATTASPYVEDWDWRDRHGRNWISPIANQGACGSCWAFASTGAVEAMVNVFFNQQINPDLAEQDVLSCSGGGTCSGGYPSKALDYIASSGVVDEVTFPYSQSDLPCTDKGTSPNQLIKIAGRTPFASTEYPRTEDDLKRMLIEMGPVSGGLYDWSHAMVLVGYKVVKEGDIFFYRDLSLQRYWKEILAGDPLIGKTVWIFKNSWGERFGDQGYVYVETPISNIGWTHGIKTPVTSLVQNYTVVFEDRDGDGYYWWGLGPKPANCPGPDQADGDDSDPTLGPLDQYGYCMLLTLAVRPVADFTSSATSVYTGENVQFTDLSENTPYNWYWEFTGGTPSTSTEKNPLVKYNSTGTFHVKLTVSNVAGSDSKTITDYINVTTAPVVVSAPVANFTTSSTAINTGQTVSFTDASTNSPTSWAWTFEGGSPSTSNVANPTVTYNTAGTFSVSLTAGNEAGSNTKAVNQLVTVSEPVVAPVADFYADKTTVNEGNTVNFSDKSLNNPAAWNWVFEGGNPSSSTERNPRVTYNNANNYRVTLTVTNAAGNNTKTIDNYIQVDPVNPEYCVPSPNAANEWISKVQIGSTSYTSGSEGYSDFSLSKTFDLESGSVNSIQLVPYFSGRSSFEYWVVWIDYNSDFNFTDNEIVFSSSKSKSAVTGSITVPTGMETTTRMRVAMGTSVPSSCDNSLSGEIEDYTVIISQPAPKPPVADFAANVYSINAGESVQFADLSTNDPTSWQWSFPGATATGSTLQNPVITYNTPGVYDVSLTVSKPGFNSSTEYKTALITVLQQGSVQYCTPAGINSSVNYIAGISIVNVYNNSTGGDGYSLSQETLDLKAGQTYTVELIPSVSSSRNFWRIWIDFNNDGDFDDSDETILTVNNNKGNVMSSITIPATANGTSRLRISMKTGKASAPCDDNFEGEVEDYKVSFGAQSDGEQMASSGAASFESDMDQNVSIAVYPNPTRDMINVKLSSLGENDFYMVYSATGSKIIENRLDQRISKIDLSMQPAGLYILVVESQNQYFTEKIIRK